MAAPDRVYRFFTNLLSKEYSISEQYPLVIRGAKPLQAYVTPNTSYSSQLEELKAKFKIDGILWLKNPNTPSVPHSDQTDEDNPDTVSITDPSDPTQTITIDDPDMNDPDRDAFIAYVWAPTGDISTDIQPYNYKFHDIRGWAGLNDDHTGEQFIQNPLSAATDFSTRGWSRASKLRYKQNGITGTAIILNDAGLNRRGDCHFPDSNVVSTYINQSVVGAIPRFNDIKVVGNFYSTNYNKLNTTVLEMSQQTITNNIINYTGFQQVANAGIIPKLGVAGDPTTAIPVKFIGRKNPNITETGYVGKISYPTGLISIGINGTISPSNPFNHDITVTIPWYAFRLKTYNEEGEITSEIYPNVEMGLYRWNYDDSINGNYQVLPNNADTDRVALSHDTPEVALSRYNNKQAAANNQIQDIGQPGSLSNDPNPTPGYQNVMNIYTPVGKFIYNGDPAGRSGYRLSAADLLFFINEQAGTYDPLLPAAYINGDTHITSAVYLTMKCDIEDQRSGEPEAGEGVYCLEYKMYPASTLTTSTNDWMCLSRFWKMEYDGTNWFWPKSRYNQNVKAALSYSTTPYTGQGIPMEVVALKGYPPNEYYVNARINNVTRGEIYRIRLINKTPSVAKLYYYDSSAQTPAWTEVTTTLQISYTSEGDINWTSVFGDNYGNIKIRRLESTAQTFMYVSTVTIEIEYKNYTTMANENNTVTVGFDLNTIGEDPNELITGVIMFNGYSDWGHDDIIPYNQGPTARPADILSCAQSLPGQPSGSSSDVAYYLGNNGKLYTSGQAPAQQGYYLVGWNGSTSAATAEDFRYVDALGNVSTLGA